MADHTESRITLHPHSRRVRILAGDTLIADTRNALELRERGYPLRQYLPRADVDMSKLSISPTGHPLPVQRRHYLSLPALFTCNCEMSTQEMQGIAGRLRF